MNQRNSSHPIIFFILLAFLLIASLFYFKPYSKNLTYFSDSEIVVLKSLWLGSLPQPPNDPTNNFNDINSAKLGQSLFFDERLSKNGKISCATCHNPELNFTDGKQLATGLEVVNSNTQSIVGSSYSPWFFWDGRKDSLWSQALAPLENPKEHGTSRNKIAQLIADDKIYIKQYSEIFHEPPDTSNQAGKNTVFVNIGKAIASYQSQLLHGWSRFDYHIDHVVNESKYPDQNILTGDEIAGGKLFIGKAQCINCHNGPLFTNFSFHNNGVLPLPGTTPSLGRASAIQVALQDKFNCYSDYNDQNFAECPELDFIKQDDENIGAHKTPSLRNLRNTEPYMHAGQLPDLDSVLKHYNKADSALVGHNEAKPLGLTRREIKQLKLFLESLQAPLASEAHWLRNPRSANARFAEPDSLSRD